MHPPFETAASLSALPRVRHGFFGRQGGVSEGEFASLNASRNVGDDLANVRENLHRAVMALKLGPVPVALAKQVHGADVLVVDEDYDLEHRPEADALVTTRPGIALGILTADCVPILLADPDAGVIGAAHAGWRGAVGGVLARTIDAMAALGAAPERIVAAVGPAIAAQSYEVGDDFADMIRREHPDAAPFIVPGRLKPHFDVPGLVMHQAQTLGLASAERTGGDSYADPDRYFSHRYGTHHETRAGRQISLIALG